MKLHHVAAQLGKLHSYQPDRLHNMARRVIRPGWARRGHFLQLETQGNFPGLA